MNYSKNELTVLCAALLAAPTGEPVHVARLGKLFSRPITLNAAIDKLRLANIITFDPYGGTLRVLAMPAWQVLNQYGMTAELFTQQRPLDEVMAHLSRCQAAAHLKEEGRRKKAEGGEPAKAGTPYSLPKPPDPPPPKPARHDMTMNSCLPDNFSIRLRALCLAGKFTEEKLRLAHEVEELARRTTAEILDNILRMAPTLTDENLIIWYQRITLESALKVNGVVREVQVQINHVNNPAGMLNDLYLRSVGAGKHKRISSAVAKTLTAENAKH